MTRQYGAYATALRKRKAAMAARLDEFADLIADGFSISAASRAMGLSQQAGSKYMGILRQRMGDRA